MRQSGGNVEELKQCKADLLLEQKKIVELETQFAQNKKVTSNQAQNDVGQAGANGQENPEKELQKQIETLKTSLDKARKDLRVAQDSLIKKTAQLEEEQKRSADLKSNLFI